MAVEDTEDLRKYHRTSLSVEPDAQVDEFTRQKRLTEKRLRLFAIISFITGVAVVLADYISSLVVRTLVDDNKLTSSTGQLFANDGFIMLAGLGCTLVFVGALGFHAAPNREGMRRLRHHIEEVKRRADQNAADLHGINQDVNQRLDSVVPFVETLEQRLDVIEESLAEIAKHLPDAIKRANWQGFNDAVREGFGEKTGTDNEARRRNGHINLVRPDPEPNA